MLVSSILMSTPLSWIDLSSALAISRQTLPLMLLKHPGRPDRKYHRKAIVRWDVQVAANPSCQADVDAEQA